jgi:outer membrane protein assembly factor BamB
MQLRKLLLPGLLSVTLLSGCSLFSGEEDVVKMSPLPTVENQFTPSTAWDVSVGNGIGDSIPTFILRMRQRCLCG